MKQYRGDQECCCGGKAEIINRTVSPHWGDEFWARCEAGKENGHCRLRDGQWKSPRQDSIQHVQGHRGCPCGWKRVRGRRVWGNRWGPVVKCVELSVRPLASTEGTGGPLGGVLNPHCRETRREQTNLKRVTSAIQGSRGGFRLRCSSGGRPKWANSRHVLHLSSATYIAGTVVSGHKFVIITSGFPGKWPNKMLSLL